MADADSTPVAPDGAAGDPGDAAAAGQDAEAAGGRWREPAIGVVVGLVGALGFAVVAIPVDSFILLVIGPPLAGGMLAGALARSGLAIGTLSGFAVGGCFGVAQLALVWSAVTGADPVAPGAGIGLFILLVLSLAYVGVATALGGLGGVVGGAVSEDL